MKRLELPPRALLNLVLAGAMIRIIGLLVPHSLWLDEGATWSNATQPTWGDTLTAEANHPPLWWLITRAWLAVSGDGSEAALRAPAAVFGILLLPLLWLVGRRLFVPSRRPQRGGFERTGDDATGERMALWFAGLATAAAYLVEYSQEARMYSLLIFETVLLTWLYLRWLDQGRRRDAVLYGLVAALTLYTQYFGLWPICAHGAHVLYLWWRSRGETRRFDPRPMVFAIIGAGLLFLPWAIYFVSKYQGIATGNPYNPVVGFLYSFWRFAAGPALVVIDRSRQVAGLGEVVREELWVIVVTAVCWFPVLFRGMWALFRQRGVASLLGFSLLVPMALLLLIYPWFQLIHERYICFLAPWIFALAVIGAFDLRGMLRHLALGGIVLVFTMGLVAYMGSSQKLEPVERQTLVRNGAEESWPLRYAAGTDDPLTFLHNGHPYGKAPWAEAHQFVTDASEKRDPVLVVLYPHYLHLVWNFYDRGETPQLQIPLEVPDRETLRRDYLPRMLDAERIFVVFGSEDAIDPSTGRNASDAVLEQLIELLDESGSMADMQVVPPILFDRSWGLRIAIINR